MNKVQEAISVGAREQSGIWEIINDLCSSLGVDREEAFFLIQNEANFIQRAQDIFFLESRRLYDSSNCVVLDPRRLKSMRLVDVEFSEKGPFYYFSNLPSI